MPSNYIGDSRSEGLTRLLFVGVNIVTAGLPILIILGLGILGGLVFGLLDIAMAVLMDSGASSSGTIGSTARRLWAWPVSVLGWVFFGDGSFPGVLTP